MEGLEFVRKYLDDILIVSSGSFGDHPMSAGHRTIAPSHRGTEN